MIGLILGLIIFTIPGFLVLEYIKFNDANKIILGIVLSFGITGLLFYALSYVIPINIFLVSIYSLILLFFLNKKKNSFKNELKNIFKSKIVNHKVSSLLFILIFVIFVIGMLYLFLVPIQTWDDLSYHVPLINDFGENGQFKTYNAPKNIFEIRANRFPKLFESTIGVMKLISEFDYWRIIPMIILLLTGYIIFIILKEVGRPTLWGPLLFISTRQILYFAISYYVDIYLSMIILTSIYFLIKYLKKNSLDMLLLMGFFLGLGILTKFTGIIFFCLIVCFLLYKTQDLFATIKMSLVTSITCAFYILLQIANLTVDNRLGIGTYGKVIGSRLLEVFSTNFIQIITIFWYFNLSHVFSSVVFLFALAFIFQKNQNKNMREILLFVFVGFILITCFFEAKPTFTGFPRYFFPIYGLLCIAAALFFEKLSETKIKSVARAIIIASVIMGMFTYSSIVTNEISKHSFGQQETFAINNYIPNHEGVTVFFTTAEPLILGLENTTVKDFSAYSNFPENVCEFLKKEKINYIVIKRNVAGMTTGNNYNLPYNNLTRSLEIEIKTSQCTKQIGEDPLDHYQVLKSLDNE